MANVNNQWVGYLDRTAAQVKQKVLSRLATIAPEMTDHNDSNILVILVDLFSGLWENLHFYIDDMAREAFLQTCRQFRSAVNLVSLLDYRIQAKNPSSANLVFTYTENGEPTNVTQTIGIPVNTLVETANGVSFLTDKGVRITPGNQSVEVSASQWTILENQPLGISNGQSGQTFSLGRDYVQGTARIFIGGVEWEQKDTLGLSSASDTHFIVNVLAERIAVIQFGDNVRGAIPINGAQIFCTYYTSLGSQGNSTAGSIDTISSTINIGTLTGTLTVTNPNPSTGGLDYETLDRIKTSAPLSVRSLNRAVTSQDFEDIARLSPGVSKAKHNFKCGRTFPIYITPDGGGIASDSLTQSTLNYINARRVVGTFPRVFAAGETRVIISLEATLNFRISETQGSAAIVAALVDYGKEENQDINKPIRLSDIIAAVDNLNEVDFLTVTRLNTIPYARPVTSNNVTPTPLQWTAETLETSEGKNTWRLQFVQLTSSFVIFKNNQFAGNVTAGSSWTDSVNVTFTIQFSTLYQDGNRWEFTTYNANRDIVLDDFTIPVVQELDLNITAIEQLNSGF